MATMKSIWLDLLEWLEETETQLPSVFPHELPPEESIDFWFRATEMEMSTRETVSTKVLHLVNGREYSSFTPLEAWLYRRRGEWAAQLALAKVQTHVEPDVPLTKVLEWALVSSWNSDGCIAFWNHAERGGKPRPENPDGMSPT
jgi:hypothetical protein